MSYNICMARSMVLGNGNTAVCLDKFGQVRDFYFPYVGQENHVGPNQMHKIGVFVDGKMHWIDNGEWHIDIRYEWNSMVSKALKAFWSWEYREKNQRSIPKSGLRPAFSIIFRAKVISTYQG